MTVTRPSNTLRLEIAIPAPGAKPTEADRRAVTTPSLPLAFRNLEHDQTMASLWNKRFTAVIDLISAEGCDGNSVRWLEAGLAKAAGITF